MDISQRNELVILTSRQCLDGQGRGIMAINGRYATADAVNMMVRYARGIVSIALSPTRAFRLGLAPMARVQPRGDNPQYLASIEALACSETGISAQERAMTVLAASNPDACSSDLVSPGHVIPMLVPDPFRKDATLPEVALSMISRRDGQDVVMWCDILDEVGDVASMDYCRKLAATLELRIHSVDNRENLVDSSLFDWQLS